VTTGTFGGEALPLVPTRMLNEFAYCLRLAYLEWVRRRLWPAASAFGWRELFWAAISIFQIAAEACSPY